MMTDAPVDTPIRADAPPSAPMALIPLFIAIGICVGISIFPQLLVAHGLANHAAASCLFWSMSAGFVRGVGFIPKNLIIRFLFSSYACFLGLLATCLLMWV